MSISALFAERFSSFAVANVGTIFGLAKYSQEKNNAFPATLAFLSVLFVEYQINILFHIFSIAPDFFSFSFFLLDISGLFL